MNENKTTFFESKQLESLGSQSKSSEPPQLPNDNGLVKFANTSVAGRELEDSYSGEIDPVR